MNIDDELIQYLQGLAKIELNTNEAEVAKRGLSALLGYMQTLARLDTAGAEPLSHPLSGSNVFREDLAISSPPREELLANAPRVREGYIVAPKTVE